MDASKDSIDKERRVFTDDDSHLLQKEKFDASLMRKLGLTFECLEWLNGRVYTGSR